MNHKKVVLLGPQRLSPRLNKAVAAARVSGPLAVITAGWEERESEDQEMRDHLGAHTVNLKVYERVEDVMAKDRELGAAIRERQDRLRVQHELYRMRLLHAMAAGRELLHRESATATPRCSKPSATAAIEAVRTLDGFHLMRVIETHREFEDDMRPLERESVDRHRREIAKIVQDCGALCIAGGHVVALLHRLRFLDVLGLVEHIPIFAWSAGRDGARRTRRPVPRQPAARRGQRRAVRGRTLARTRACCRCRTPRSACTCTTAARVDLRAAFRAGGGRGLRLR
jgi:hypothetical protein